MILDFIISIFANIIMGILYLIPTLPSISFEISGIINDFMLIISNGIGLYRYLIGSNLFNITISIMVGFMGFYILYLPFMWILRKFGIK